MRYFIRTPRLSAGKLLGPFDPIETLRRARTLRETGVDFCITARQERCSSARIRFGAARIEFYSISRHDVELAFTTIECFLKPSRVPRSSLHATMEMNT
jgi:hypothetical protein